MIDIYGVISGICLFGLIRFSIARWTNFFEKNEAKWCFLAAALASFFTQMYGLWIACLVALIVSGIMSLKVFYNSRFYNNSEVIFSIVFAVIVVLPIAIFFNDGSIINGVLSIKSYLVGVILGSVIFPKGNLYIRDSV